MVNRKMRYYPIALDLSDIRVLVVGGGKVAEHKVKVLLKFWAQVRVVSPSLTENLKKLLRARRIKWLNRIVKASDIAGVDIVIAATYSEAVNRNISAWAKKKGLLVNVVDNAELSTFISPAVFSIDKAVVAVYTHGRDPVLSRDLKNFLKEHWDEFLSYRDRL